MKRREQAAELRKAGALGMTTDGRPNKKQRRQIHQLHGSFSESIAGQACSHRDRISRRHLLSL